MSLFNKKDDGMPMTPYFGRRCRNPDPEVLDSYEEGDRQGDIGVSSRGLPPKKIHNTAEGDWCTPEKAVLVTSALDEGMKYHAPVIDLDLPCMLVPSTTPGHYHLYIDQIIPQEKFWKLLDALVEADLVEPGYASASKARGYSAVRAPHVKKNK